MDEIIPKFTGVIVTPARMDIPTLPGRPLRPLGRETVLGQWLKRARLVSPNVRVIVTTSDQQSDRPILEHCLSAGVPCLVDSSTNAQLHLEEVICSLCIDGVAFCSLSNPLFEPSLLRAAFAHLVETRSEYVTYSGLPLGCAVEVLSRQAYLDLARGLRAGKPFSASVLPAPFLYSAPELSFKCETEADYLRLLSLYSELLPNADGIVGLDDVIASVQKSQPLRRAA